MEIQPSDMVLQYIVVYLSHTNLVHHGKSWFLTRNIYIYIFDIYIYMIYIYMIYIWYSPYMVFIYIMVNHGWSSGIVGTMWETPAAINLSSSHLGMVETWRIDGWMLLTKPGWFFQTGLTMYSIVENILLYFYHTIVLSSGIIHDNTMYLYIYIYMIFTIYLFSNLVIVLCVCLFAHIYLYIVILFMLFACVSFLSLYIYIYIYLYIHNVISWFCCVVMCCVVLR